MDPNKRNGTGTRLQLRAKSTLETKYLYGQHPLFGSCFSRHTPYGRESVETPFVDHSLGNETVFDLDSLDCDLLGDIFVVLDLPALGSSDPGVAVGWCDAAGYAAMDVVKINCGSTTLLETNGETLFLENELAVTASKRDGYHAMIGKYHTDMSLSTNAKFRKRVYLEIPFLRTRYNRQFLPVMDRDVQVRVRTKPLSKLVYSGSHDVHVDLRVNRQTGHVSVNVRDAEPVLKGAVKMALSLDKIYLDRVERVHFKVNTFEYIFRQHQKLVYDFGKHVSRGVIKLEFKNAVSFLVFVCARKSDIDANRHFKYLPVKRFKWTVNGNDSDYADGEVFRFRNFHGTLLNRYAYVFPFSLSPNDTQPTGSFNFSASTKNLIHYELVDVPETRTSVRVYAVSHNTMVSDGTTCVVKFVV